MYSDLEKNKKKQLFSLSLFRHRTKRILSDHEMEYQKNLDISTIYMILFLVMGIVFALFQTFSIRTCSIWLAIFSFVFGIIKGYSFLQRRRFSFYRFSIFSFIFGIVFSLFLFFAVTFVEQHYSFLMGIFIFFLTIERFFNCFFFFRMKDRSRYVFLSSCCLSFLMGIIMIINPFTQLLFGEVFGIFCIFFSLLNLSMISLLQRSIVFYVACFD